MIRAGIWLNIIGLKVIVVEGLYGCANSFGVSF
jgi:hypothetical protein